MSLRCPFEFTTTIRHGARGFLAIGLLAMLAGGCTRSQYRRQADCDAYAVVGQAASCPRWELKDYTIDANCQSRFFDPNNPDEEPMPPDDPTAHQLMHCVDGKKGWKHWHRNGDTPYTENPCWRTYLPVNAEGDVILDREAAIHLSMIHSREYQTELEDLYISALDVAYQRFLFDVQFFGNQSVTATTQGRLHSGSGGESLNSLALGNSLEARKLFATGGELVTGVANNIVWQFSGPDTYANTTLLDFTLLQPLLRAGGRAVVLERLTDAERTLLSNVRQMERFRRGFYVQIYNGRNPGPGPTANGTAISALAPAVTAQAIGTAAGQVVSFGGIVGLLTDQQNIRNQEQNVIQLRSALEQLETVYEAGRIDRFQVELARQSLYNAQSRLLGLEKSHQDRLDTYKITLGLPPALPMRVSDSMLEPFNMIGKETRAAMMAMAEVLQHLRDASRGDQGANVKDFAPELADLVERIRVMQRQIEQDMERLHAALPARFASLRRLGSREELKRGEIEPGLIDVDKLAERTKTLDGDFERLSTRLGKTVERIDEFQREVASGGRQASAERLKKALADGMMLAGDISSMALVQAQARLDSLTLVPVDLDPDEALDIARANRLDWMNARTALVDQWRQIEVRANALKGTLNLRMSGDLSTTGNDPLHFTSTTGRLRMGMEFDAPLTRLLERNLYRESLIEYQRARRAYTAVEDRISQSLRNILRTTTLDQLNFEIRRAAVAVAIMQTELTRYRLERPPRPNESSQVSPTLARDLVQSLTDLLNAQNDIVGVWVDYESQRMNLDLDLGTMQLDQRGMWVDPGPISRDFAESQKPEEVPMPPDAPMPPPAPMPPQP